MEELHIGNLKIKLPIIQGGMGIGVSMSGLAGTVANHGGVGVIAVAGLGMFEPDYARNFLEANARALKKEIQKAKAMTDGVLGVNIMVALTNFSNLVKTSIEEGIDIIFAGAGLPLNLPQYLTEGAKTKLGPIVSSGRAAKILCSKWKGLFDYLPDAIVVEGPKAGGHLGFKREQLDDPDFALEKLLPEVVEQVKYFEEKYRTKIPVIAAGGIYTGGDIKNIMDMGASGVQMGTRFVTTDECDASMDFKQTYIDSKEEDMEIVNSPVGMPGRAIFNEFIAKVRRGEKRPIKCPYQCLRTCDIKTTPYCIVAVLVNAQKGNFYNGYAFAGSNAYKATKVISVKETIESLVREYKEE
ncbi:MAG: nitronate monooxygenase [Bacteroidetes bacterium]|nr:nitronate monooxygenase [Bacteroidota bacterium]